MYIDFGGGEVVLFEGWFHAWSWWEERMGVVDVCMLTWPPARVTSPN